MYVQLFICTHCIILYSENVSFFFLLCMAVCSSSLLFLCRYPKKKWRPWCRLIEETMEWATKENCTLLLHVGLLQQYVKKFFVNSKTVCLIFASSSSGVIIKTVDIMSKRHLCILHVLISFCKTSRVAEHMCTVITLRHANILVRCDALFGGSLAKGERSLLAYCPA